MRGKGEGGGGGERAGGHGTDRREGRRLANDRCWPRHRDGDAVREQAGGRGGKRRRPATSRAVANPRGKRRSGAARTRGTQAGAATVPPPTPPRVTVAVAASRAWRRAARHSRWRRWRLRGHNGQR